MNGLEQLFAIAASAVVVVGALGGLWVKVLRPRIRRLNETVDAAVAAVVGREEIRDPATGRIVAESVPGIGVRMSNVEDAITLLVANQRRLDDHDRRIVKLEEAAVERIVARADSALGWAAVSAAIKADAGEVADEVDELGTELD